MKNSQFALLTTNRFLPLFVAQFLGAFNDNVFKNALVILITYRLATASGMNAQMLVTAAAGIFIFPFFIFSATAGQLADKFEKASLIYIIKFAEIIVMLLAVLGFYLQSVSLLITVLFLLGTQATFFGPLKYSILPDQLHENELIAGNGLIEASTFIAILIGTILGGLLILSAQGTLLISIAILLASICGWLVSLSIKKTGHYDSAVKINYNIFQETIRILRYSKTHWQLYLSILGISWFWLVGAVFLAEFPVFAKDVLHSDSQVVTYFFTLFSIGLAIGSLLCNKLLKGKIQATYVPLGALGITLFTIDLYYASQAVHALPVNGLLTLTQFLHTFNGWRITVDLLLIAVSGGLYTVPLYAILQTRSEEQHRARVIASNNIMNALFMVAAAVGTMLMLTYHFTITQVFLTVAIINGFVAIYICKLLPDVLVKNFFRTILRLLYRVKIIGLENYKAAGERVIIVANHTSFIDALLLAAFLPDRLTFAINTNTAKKWWIRLFMRLVNTFALDPTNPMAVKSLIEYVQKDKRCVIFPEGRITMTGALMKVYEGPGLIADKSAAQLLPIRIEGAQYTPFSRLRGKVHIHWMPTIRITIFPPQQIEIDGEVKGRKRRQQVGHKLYDLMSKIIFESSNYRKTLFTSLLEAKAIHGAHHKIMEDIERDPVNYHKFILHCYALGRTIAKQTEPGEYVGILLPNMVSTVTTFFAMQAFSRVPAMLNYSTGIHNVVLACQTAQLKTVYTSLKFIRLAKLMPMIDALKAIGVNVVFLENLSKQISTIDKFKSIFYAKFSRLSYRLIHLSKKYAGLNNADNPAVILFTSGSEGTPKGVVLSHSNIQANRYQLNACVDFNAHDVIFNALPIFHSFGLTGGMLLPLLSGVKTFFYPSPLHYRIVPELAYDTNATILFGTDTFLAGYAKYAHQYDFYSVRYVFAGAEKLREETRLNWMQKFGVRIFEGYGATEAAPVIAINTPMNNKAGTVGRILPGIQYKLRTEAGIEKGGILEIFGPNIMRGYFLSKEPGVLVAPENGWYDTGDVVTIDEDNFVTIVGRIKRFAKIAGEMVSLTMVEQQINKLWPEYQHAVVNIADPKKGEQIVLVTTNPDAAREEIIAHAKQNQMAEIAIPKKIKIVKTMPLLGTGKIDYVAVKAEVAGE